MSALPTKVDKVAEPAGCPLCAKSRREQSQQRASYSITRSARASTVSGIVMPSAFAVRRLIDNSTCVGCWTGRSKGFAPVKIFFTYSAVR